MINSKLKVLCVEDNDTKFERMMALVFTPMGDTLVEKVHRASDFNEASKSLASHYFDLVILDIRLPVMKGGVARADVSSDIIQLITRGEAVIPSYIIGLTEFPEELATAAGFPIEYFSVEHYTSVGTDWAAKIRRHVEFISRSKLAAVNFHIANFDYDVLIITARSENEFKPIDEAMEWDPGSVLVDERFRPCEVKTGTWNTRGGFAFKTVSLCVQRAGLASAAAAAANAISYFRPKVVAMLGMCCGLNRDGASDPLSLGDVLIMSETYCWDEGRYTAIAEGIGKRSHKATNEREVSFFEARPSSGTMSTEFRRIADAMIEKDKVEISQLLATHYRNHRSSTEVISAGKKLPEKPAVRMGPNVSGSSVVAAKAQAQEILSRFSMAMGLEMETHAVYWACYMSLGAKPEAVCIKGIADFGDGSKSKEFQKIASIGSLLVFERMLENYSRSSSQ